ncbi:type II secretion system protein GspG [Limnoglobus roseus]|uniref:Prepilin-type cleavage/methylation domain-containing protein n=1 Tax=Limnoglobus roseus TaxID=2598579 RepID=A0A5C1AKV2_9BACT|nr:type II secretion system protein GspG [Limnoglobus roseus]QEL18797.1 prepilin-type cleavage/methylation domain-containing protein [Limnoglobus roseus]
MLVAQHSPLNHTRRSAFTLLEVLVVVAIIVILAGGAGVYVFGYLEDAKVDTARNTITMLETQCKAYAAKNGGQLPGTLQELVAPTNGKSPLIDGGPNVLLDPWGNQYQYNPDNTNQYTGEPDPMVWTTSKKGPIYSNARR